LIVVGLGNPGAEYDGTRHNVGFRVVDQLGKKCGAAFRPGNRRYLYFRMRTGEADFVIAKPLTYMNKSGDAVTEILDRFCGSVDRLLVVVDDVEIPLGTLRIRRSGSDGGHNGLASVIQALHTGDFPRLRCGIGGTARVSGEQLSSFVLSSFGKEERELVHSVVHRATDAVELFAVGGIDKAMSSYNS
jgi:PTH1 family peptidyl-tRNA hydrolase